MPLYERPHELHDQHLCSMVARGTTLAEYKDLVRNPQYICRQCGRVAAKAENLCDPTTM